MYTVPSPNAERAAWALDSLGAFSWSSDSTTFMPMPPPPPDGLIITGKPIRRAASAAVAGSTAPLPGVTGTPLSIASFRAASFEPSALIADPGGPMNLIPAASHASGNAAFSERKAVAGVNRLGAAVVRALDDPVELQVRLGRSRPADVKRLVCVPDVDGVAVGVRIDGCGRDAELAARPHHPDRDLASIRDENFVEELPFHAIASRGWLGLTTSPSLT